MMIATSLAAAAAPPSLAERLGYKPTDRVLIINGDDAGMCHAANEGTIDALEHGLMTSATIMVPCPWFSEIAEYARKHPEKDFGIHLCHTSEWKYYRWGPVAPRNEVPSLIDQDGYFWHEVPDVYEHGKPAEALIEGRAQIKRALAAGVDVTHIDSHMGTLQLRPDFIEVYLQLATEFDLPARMGSRESARKMGLETWLDRFTAKGIVFTDHFIYEELKDEKDDVKGFWANILRNLTPGVTELYIHAAKPTVELQNITGSWRTRGAEYETFTNDPEIRKIITDEKIILVGYRALRELQRGARKPTVP